MKVREIMTTDPTSAEPDTTLEEIATMMKEEDVGAIPVLEEGKLCGIVTDRDIVVRCVAEGRDPSEVTAEDVMSEDIQTIEPGMDVEDAAGLMASRQIRRLPVVKSGKLLGMVSLGDIAVKTGEEDEATTADTLEDISAGVKGSSGAARGSERGDRREVSARRGAQSGRSGKRQSGRRRAS